MAINQISYLELPASNITELQPFYGQLFGWTYEDWGPDYTTARGSGLELGFNGDAPSRSKAPLAMIDTNSTEEMERRVQASRRTNYDADLRIPRRTAVSFRRPVRQRTCGFSDYWLMTSSVI